MTTFLIIFVLVLIVVIVYFLIKKEDQKNKDISYLNNFFKQVSGSFHKHYFNCSSLNYTNDSLYIKLIKEIDESFDTLIRKLKYFRNGKLLYYKGDENSSIFTKKVMSITKDFLRKYPFSVRNSMNKKDLLKLKEEFYSKIKVILETN